MKKNVKSILAGLAAAALLAGFSSCSNGSSDDTLTNTNSTGTTGTTGTTPGQTEKSTDDVFSGDEITYVINVASKDNENTKLILQYDRSAAGAKELISLTDAELSLTINGEAVTTPGTITFALDEYSSFEKAAGQKEEDESKQKQYKCKIDLNKQLSVNDTVKLQLKKAKVTGEGASTVKLGSIVATIVDTAEAANWWTELSETKYQPIITKKNGGDLNATTVVEEPAATPTPTTTPTATPTTDPAATPTNTPAADPANTNTPAANTPAATETTLFEGEQTLAWSPEGTNLALDKGKFTGEKKTILVTYKKTGDGSVIQLINRTGWAKISDLNSKVTGSVAQKESAPYDEIYPWGASEDGNTTEWTFTFTPSDDDWSGIVSEGFAVQGNGTVIKKVVLK